jgi:vacuolar-type H+-ATPase subunit H
MAQPNAAPIGKVSPKDLQTIGNEKKVPKTFTVNSFLTNPTGNPGNASAQAKLYLDSIRSKLANMLRRGKKFAHSYFRVASSIFVTVKVPSESYDDLFYDVVFEFQEVEGTPTSLTTYNIRFFTNGPSFNFTYAYIFNFHDLLIEFLKDKLAKKALDTYPEKRNPDAIMFFEKSITFALIYLKDNHLLDRSAYATSMVPLNKIKFKQSVPSSVTKLEEYNKAKTAAEHTKIAEKKAKRIARQAPKETITAGLDHLEKGRKNRSKKGISVTNTGKNKANFTVNNKVDNKLNNKVNNKVKK